MRLLLDTHAFIWWSEEPERLTPQVLELCHDRSNEILLSIASIWEMQIKIQLGKLALRFPLVTAIEAQIDNGLEILPISQWHIYALSALPSIHGDPFDRLLIAQAFYEEIPVITHDAKFDHYPVTVIW